MPRTRWTRLLAAALFVDLVCSVALNLDEDRRLLRGNLDLVGVLSAVGLITTVIVVVAGVGLASSLRRARRDLYRREQSLGADASMSTDWLWESDTDLRLTYSSDGVRSLLGHETKDVIGQSALIFLSEGERAATRALATDATAHRRGWQDTDLTWQHADGTLVLLREMAAPIMDESGRVTGFRGRRRAVSDAEIAEKAIEEVRRRISAVISRADVDIVLQPIVDIRTGRLGGAEALARFRDGRTPDQWFSEARDAGMSLELDRCTFNRALAAVEHLPQHAYLSINATPELVLSGHLANDLLARGIPLPRVVVEITEHARIEDYDAIRAALSPLRARGTRLAIDDTGAGYASLSHVLRLRPDIIKIDRSLIADVSADPARRSLITALVLLAVNLGASVTAEGIETPSELETLATLGADHGQGYLLGRPTPVPAEWQRWVDQDWFAAPQPPAQLSRNDRTGPVNSRPA